MPTSWPVGTTYCGGLRNAGPYDVDDPRNDDAEHDIAILKDFFTSLEWWKLDNANALVSGDVTRLEEGFCY